MDLDWCTEDNLQNTSIFNEQSVISSKSKKQIENTKQNEENFKKDELKVENCFSQKTKCETLFDILNVLGYLSAVSNHLRTFIRSKSLKNFTDNNQNNQNNNIDNNIDNDITIPEINNICITESEFNLVIKYLEWIRDASIDVKKHFANTYRKDNSYDPNSIKLFKTSSYKFCNFKETCSVHRNKNRSCDKNHFVF